MASSIKASETVLIVDDEQPVRKTFQEWLEEANFGCQILTAADAETALLEANRNPVDLAILDWNLGAGNDGLHLLEDLYVFNPDVVAIMVTGYAHQATPLDAMRMGVRDYLDKNHDLDRDTFLTAVRRQLERIRPAKRERQLRQSLAAFQEAVQKILALVQSIAALNDPVPLPEAVRSLFRFLLRTTGARDGVLITRSYDGERQPSEICRVYQASGAMLDVPLVPFARSVAGSVISMQDPAAINDLDRLPAETFDLQLFERGRHSLLAAPVAVAPGVHVILELFDKQESKGGSQKPGFTEDDRQLVAAAADFGTEMLRQALAERQTHQMLVDAIDAALGASDSVVESMQGSVGQGLEHPPSSAVLDQLREGLRAASGEPVAAEDTLKLAEAIRILALRHGPVTLRHCAHLVENLRELLDTVTGRPGA